MAPVPPRQREQRRVSVSSKAEEPTDSDAAEEEDEDYEEEDDGVHEEDGEAETGSDEAAAAAAAAAAIATAAKMTSPAADDQPWVCHECTFVNENPAASSCDACGSPRKQKKRHDDDDDDGHHHHHHHHHHHASRTEKKLIRQPSDSGGARVKRPPKEQKLHGWERFSYQRPKTPVELLADKELQEEIKAADRAFRHSTRGGAKRDTYFNAVDLSQLAFMNDERKSAKRGIFLSSADLVLFCVVCAIWCLTAWASVQFHVMLRPPLATPMHVCSSVPVVAASLRDKDRNGAERCLARSSFDPSFFVREACNATNEAQRFVVEPLEATPLLPDPHSAWRRYRLYQGGPISQHDASATVPFAVDQWCAGKVATAGTSIVREPCLYPAQARQAWFIERKEGKLPVPGAVPGTEDGTEDDSYEEGTYQFSMPSTEQAGIRNCLAAGFKVHKTTKFLGTGKAFHPSAVSIPRCFQADTATASVATSLLRLTKWGNTSDTGPIAALPTLGPSDFCTDHASLCTHMFLGYQFPVSMNYAASSQWQHLNAVLCLCWTFATVSLILSLHVVKQAIVHQLRHADARIRGCCWLCPCGVPCLGPVLRKLSGGRCKQGQPRAEADDTRILWKSDSIIGLAPQLLLHCIVLSMMAVTPVDVILTPASQLFDPSTRLLFSAKLFADGAYQSSDIRLNAQSTGTMFETKVPRYKDNLVRAG